MRIAVIDDEPGILLTLRLFLEMEGHTPLLFSSPIKALEEIIKKSVDLIILDIRMPELSGEELAGILKKNPRTCNIPIILLSAHETLPDVALRVGAYGTLEKPFQLEKLNNMIKRIAEG